MSPLTGALQDILAEAEGGRVDNEIVLLNRALAALARPLRSTDTPAAAKVACWALQMENPRPLELGALPSPVIRAMLRRPSASQERVYFLASYVGAAPRDSVLRARWKAGLAALEVARVADIYGLSSKREAQVPLSALALDARAVAAARETSLACQHVPASLLALLVLDGSASSISALEPRLRAAADSDAELELMRKLEPLGRGAPAVKALLARVRQGVASRSTSSGALVVLAAAQITGVTEFFLELDVSSMEQVKPYPLLPAVPKVRVRLRIDSREIHWFSVVVDAPPAVPALCFGYDEARLDRKRLPVSGCAAEDLPAWFDALAKKALLSWDWDHMKLTTSLRAKRRQRFQAWLRSLGGASLSSFPRPARRRAK